MTLGLNKQWTQKEEDLFLQLHMQKATQQLEKWDVNFDNGITARECGRQAWLMTSSNIGGHWKWGGGVAGRRAGGNSGIDANPVGSTSWSRPRRAGVTVTMKQRCSSFFHAASFTGDWGHCRNGQQRGRPVHRGVGTEVLVPVLWKYWNSKRLWYIY